MNELLNSKRVIIYISLLWIVVFELLLFFSINYSVKKIIIFIFAFPPAIIFKMLRIEFFLTEMDDPNPIGIVGLIIWVVVFLYLLSKLTILILKTFINKNSQ